MTIVAVEQAGGTFEDDLGTVLKPLGEAAEPSWRGEPAIRCNPSG